MIEEKTFSKRLHEQQFRDYKTEHEFVLLLTALRTLTNKPVRSNIPKANGLTCDIWKLDDADKFPELGIPVKEAIVFIWRDQQKKIITLTLAPLEMSAGIQEAIDKHMIKFCVDLVKSGYSLPDRIQEMLPPTMSG